MFSNGSLGNNNIVTESGEFKFFLNATVRCAHITPTGLLKLKLYFYLCIHNNI